MEHPTCTVRTETLRSGTLQTVMWLCVLYLILAVLPGGLFLAGQAMNKTGLIIFLALLALLPASLYVLLPRKIVRISPFGIRIRAFGIGKSRTIPWEAVEACDLGTNNIGVRHNSRNVTVVKGMFHKKDWPELHSTMSHYFEYLFGITAESEDARRKALLKHKTIWHAVLDKAALLTVALAFFAAQFAACVPNAFPNHRPLVIAAAIVITTAAILIMRKQLRLHKRLQWCPVFEAND